MKKKDFKGIISEAARAMALLALCAVLTAACGNAKTASSVGAKNTEAPDAAASSSASENDGGGSGGAAGLAEGGSASGGDNGGASDGQDAVTVAEAGASEARKPAEPSEAAKPDAATKSPDAASAAQAVQASDEGEVIDIKEKLFIAQTNDIYLNAEEYLGKTLRYQGFVETVNDEDTGETYYFVIRNGPGCCPGVDSTAGFEVAWDKPYPNRDDWVEATGVLEEYEFEPGVKYLRIQLKSLLVLAERGADTVVS